MVAFEFLSSLQPHKLDALEILCPSLRCTSIWGGRQHLLNSCIFVKSWYLMKLLGSGRGRQSWAATSTPSTSPRVSLHTPVDRTNLDIYTFPVHAMLSQATSLPLLMLPPCQGHSPAYPTPLCLSKGPTQSTPPPRGLFQLPGFNTFPPLSSRHSWCIPWLECSYRYIAMTCTLPFREVLMVGKHV